MGDYSMKTRALLKVGICVAVLLVPMQVYAVGPQNVSNTVHNLGSAGEGPFTAEPFAAGGTDEVCVFCHTPHNSSGDLPLWNRYSTNTAKGFLMYTSSSTLSSEVKANTGLSANSPSRLCLTCHDGTTAINALFSLAATGGARPVLQDPFMLSFSNDPDIYTPGEGPYLGTNLTNMHPINFNYRLAQEDDDDLYAIGVVKNGGLKFFDDGAGGTPEYMECATCHDPHVDFGFIQDVEQPLAEGGDKRYRPFLRKPNISSGLCLTCHDK